MKVLLTGACGFIGRHALRHLVATGSEVHTVDMRPLPDGLTGTRHHLINLSDRAQMRQTVSEIKPSHLLHFAWYVTPGEFWTARDNIQCLEDSLQLLTVFLDSGGRRSVVSGTCAEYDWSSDGLLRESDTRIQPLTLYGASKAALFMMHARLAGLAKSSCAWGRIFHLYGPFEPESRFVPSVIRALLRGQEAKCTHGRQVRDFMHVDDIARAFVELLFHPTEGAVNIASGQPVMLADVAQQIAGIVGRPDLLRLGALAEPPGDPPRLVAEVDRLSRIGFVPRYSLSSGLRQTVEWWRERLAGKV